MTFASSRMRSKYARLVSVFWKFLTCRLSFISAAVVGATAVRSMSFCARFAYDSI